jgi:ketosteroid isomerase-like protein
VSAVASLHVSLVRSICAAWERGDYSSVDWADPQIEFTIADGPEPRCVSGAADLSAELLGFQRSWGEYHSEPVEYQEIDAERVLVLTLASGRGRASGLEIRQERANLFHVRRGKVVKLVAYWDRGNALADVPPPRWRSAARGAVECHQPRDARRPVEVVGAAR